MTDKEIIEGVRRATELVLIDYLNGKIHLFDAEDKILSHKNIAIIDPIAKVPCRNALGAKDNVYRDTYMQGQIDAQQKMLDEGWVKRVTK